MTTWKDVFINILIFGGWYLSILLIGRAGLINNDFVLAVVAVFSCWVIYFTIYKKLQNRRRTGIFLEKDFAALNYRIVYERPLTFKEQYENFEFDFGPFIDGILIRRLRCKSGIKRHFVVRNENDYDFELIVTITQTWTEKLRYRIDSTSRIRN